MAAPIEPADLSVKDLEQWRAVAKAANIKIEN